MKKLVIVNYWIMSFAWSLCLCDMDVYGIVLGVLATIVLSAFGKGINFWRMLANALLTTMMVIPVYFVTNIHYYFPMMSVFLVVISFNSAVASEILCLYKSRYIYPFIATMFVGTLMLALIIVVLPGEDYTLFTKQSLYIMNGFIFLPYMVRPVLCVIIRALKKMIRSAYQVLALSK